MEIKGKIKKIFETKTFGPSGFRKRELILVTDEQYPQFLKIEFVQDKVDILDQFKPGDDVTISFDLRGREWVNPEGETIYFNSIRGWRIVKTDAQLPPDDVPPPFPGEDISQLPPEEDDDLPF